MDKKRSKPSDVCQYGKNCNRKNPHHFMEYFHEHLEKIISQNSTDCPTEQYDIPKEFHKQKDLILEQIKIIIQLFPRNSIQHSKKAKFDQVTAIDGLENQSSPNVNKIQSNMPSTSQREGTKHVDIHKYLKVVPIKGQMQKKLAAAYPYNYFLTSISSAPATHTEPLSVTFQELLDPSLGELECSVQINFMVEIGWLLAQYYFAGYINKPLLILYGSGNANSEIPQVHKSKVTAHLIKMPTPFSTHHTKMMLFGYTDGSMRVIVSTANLYEDDWDNRTQGLWISEKLEALPKDSDTTAGESPTGFRNELLKYLSSYKTPDLQPWLVRIRKSNFSSVNVFLVTSIPGTFQETSSEGFPHGHARVASLLSKHSTAISDHQAPIVAQCSSIGSFGSKRADSWLNSDLVNSFRRDSQPMGLRKIPNLRIIYPSFSNVLQSHDGLIGGGCLPYGVATHSKQLWLNELLFQWKADIRSRSKAMPHIKTYCRWSEKRMHWFILTSANLSKAAWGAFSKSKTVQSLRISNYEAGILFLPKFVTKTSYFSMDKADITTPLFPALYDIPLTKYGPTDEPFLQ